MKPITKLLLFLFITASLYACQKQPTANFTSDKDTYTSGEAIHLTDASTNAENWKWTLPDGTISNEKNLDYVIDINEIDCTKNITLEVTSKKNKKANSLTKTITIKQAILSTDYFSCYGVSKNPYGLINRTAIPSSKSADKIGANWLIQASAPTQSFGLGIYFPSINRPSLPATYDLTSSYSSLLSNQVCVTIKTFSSEDWGTCYSVSGQVNVSIGSNGKVRSIFNNVSGKFITNHGDTVMAVMSGDITCY